MEEERELEKENMCVCVCVRERECVPVKMDGRHKESLRVCRRETVARGVVGI
jgi:hypothetical protein